MPHGHEFGRISDPEHFSRLSIDDLGRTERDSLSQECLTAFGRLDEANVLTVGFVPGSQSDPFGVNAHVIFLHRTNRKQQHRQVLLIEIPEHVTLILLVVDTANEFEYSIAFENLGVMARCHGVESEALGPLKEKIEFYVSVAFDARIRGRSLRVTLNERFDDVPVEFLGVVKDVMIDPEHLSHPSSVVNVSDRTASRI